MIEVLVVDDQRIFKTIPDEQDVPVITHVTTSQDGLSLLWSQAWDIVILDHDLGMESYGSGTDIVNAIEHRTIVFTDPPKVGRWIICSFNPIGVRRMLGVLAGLGFEGQAIDPSTFLDYDAMRAADRNPYLAGPRQ